MSKWPPSENGQFTQAWISLDKLPGSMMQGPDGLFGPIPALTHCLITTNPDEAEGWRTAGKPVLAICTLGVKEAQREQSRAVFDAKVRTHGYVDRVTGERVYDPDALGVDVPGEGKKNG